ncbi:MAG: apolipoprotein N-acyltransferase [Polyangiales bacterium]
MLGALSFPTPGLWPLVFVAWVPLFYAIGLGGVLAGALAGLVCGLAFFSILLRWIALTTPTGLVVVALWSSLFFAAAGGATAVLRDRPLVIPFVWIALEWMRGFLFVGFGWGAFGYALARAPSLAQLAALGGVPLLGLAIVGTNVALSRRRFPVAAALPLALWVLGLASPRASSDRTKKIAVVDAAIDPRAKWGTGGTFVALTRHGSLTDAIAHEHPAFIVWPETALPTVLDAPDSMAIRKTALERRAALVWHAPLLMGVPEAGPEGRFFNSVAMITSEDAAIVYRKRRLVPFGEYTPTRALKQVLPGPEFVPGDGGPPIEIGGARVGALICFDDVFPEEVAARSDGADVLALLTNDAWLGDTGAAQHLDIAVLRAIENRRTVVRAANGGTIGAIGPDGRALKLAPAGEAALVVDAPLVDARTPYARMPDLVPLVCLLIGTFGVALTASNRGPQRTLAASAARRLPPSRRTWSRRRAQGDNAAIDRPRDRRRRA